MAIYIIKKKELQNILARDKVGKKNLATPP